LTFDRRPTCSTIKEKKRKEKKKKEKKKKQSERRKWFTAVCIAGMWDDSNELSSRVEFGHSGSKDKGFYKISGSLSDLKKLFGVEGNPRLSSIISLVPKLGVGGLSKASIGSIQEEEFVAEASREEEEEEEEAGTEEEGLEDDEEEREEEREEEKEGSEVDRRTKGG